MLRNDLAELAKNAPRNGYVESGLWAVLFIKELYEVSDYYIVEVLEDMKNIGEIEDVIVNYDRKNGHILSYKFR